MTDGIMLQISDDGKATLYESTYDITIHCESEKEQREVIERLNSMNWIPCSERLPEKEVVYIITVHYNDRIFITFDNFCSYKHGWKEWSNQEVLAWMPLPEPYREEK
jgi:hypothetical protein